MQTFPTSVPTAEHTVATAVGPAERGAPGTVIDVRHVTKTFGQTVAVDDLSFALDAGEIVGLLGEKCGRARRLGLPNCCSKFALLHVFDVVVPHLKQFDERQKYSTLRVSLLARSCSA